MHLFHHSEFSDRDALLGLKLQSGYAVSVCIPTLNEAATIGEIVSQLRQMCTGQLCLIDEILVIDSGSNDDTCKIASEAGAVVWKSAEIAPAAGSHLGKGENLWKALHVARGDIICYLDADVVNFHGGFLCGLLGPLLKIPTLSYVKAYYQRPLMEHDVILPDSGGRVSEILVRPLISMFYPELIDVIQPLAGEYAARRELLEQLAYPVGYGVEIAHLIDLAAMGKLDHFGQTDLSCRVHRNRDDGELGDAAFAILQVMLRRLERDGKINLNHSNSDIHHRWSMGADGLRKMSKSLPEPERPPIQSWHIQHDKALCAKAAVEDARSHL